MKVLPAKPQQLGVVLWKSKFNENNALLTQGTLQVLIDEQLLGTYDSAAIPARHFTKFNFPILPG